MHPLLEWGGGLSHKLPSGREAPIAFYSRTLSKAERNYSQLDREALAVVAAVKKFHEYLYGRSFTIVTDHKPLLGIVAGDKPTPNILSPRMLRWTEFLAAYSYKLIHRPGKDIGHADALSRCPLPCHKEDFELETHTFFLETVAKLPVHAAEIARETAKEAVLAPVMGWIKKGWPLQDLPHLAQPFKSRQTELSVLRGCILWGNRVVIPAKLQREVLEMLHEGHPGIVRMKGLARSYVWWPGIDKMVENWVASCPNCQVVRPAPPHAPTQEWECPRGPWSRIHIDFAGPTRGHTFLVIVDAYSKWLEVILMTSTTTEAVIKQLRKLFVTHGLPDVLVSDNGPQFTFNIFESFLAQQGIRHALTAPGHPSANGRAERMVRFTKEKLQQLGPGDITEKLEKLLSVQHITPSPSTNLSPAELLMGRKLRSSLDRLHPTYAPNAPLDSTSKVRSL
uniref:Gypsy retrotransposon integrase-like protein 1 n=1 Tax=Naja naja TaxID=35670 RepID=A0A8C6VFG1_NAJNA